MADTVDLNNLEEFYDNDDKLKTKISDVVKLIQNAKHCIVFTGAGISTSAKIPDFRGINGVWTRQAQGKSAPSGISLEQAIPTYCHMALAALVEKGVVKYVVSQNIDGLHRRSGIVADRISELHGNCYLETCWDCNAESLRTFDVSQGGGIGGVGCPVCLKRVPHFCHCTARKCKCGAQMKDSIIHFKENLPVDALEKAMTQGRKADLCIALGSSLTVSPACLIPQETLDAGGKVVVINLQKTSYDSKSAVRLFSKIDETMQAIMAALKIEVPSYEESQACIDEQDRKKSAEQEGVKRPTANPNNDDSQFMVGGAAKNPKNPKKQARNGSKAQETENSLMNRAKSLLASLKLPVFGGKAATVSSQENLKESDRKSNQSGILFDQAEASFLNTFPSAPSSGYSVDAEKDRGGYVNPITNCPHVKEISIPPLTMKDAAILVQAPCGTCGDSRENWYCEVCRFVGCSRYVAGHMQKHASSHVIATSLRDLNTWCYKCESYISSPSLVSSRAAVYFAKFGTLPADMLAALPASTIKAATDELKSNTASSASDSTTSDTASVSSLSSESTSTSSLLPHNHENVDTSMEEDKGGYVDPIKNCPHVAALVVTPLTIAKASELVNASCNICNDKQENWYCEHCRFVGCSRYVSGHLSKHNQDVPGHVLATSLRDLNTWCYSCEAYVVSPNLQLSRSAVYLAKFGSLPPV